MDAFSGFGTRTQFIWSKNVAWLKECKVFRVLHPRILSIYFYLNTIIIRGWHQNRPTISNVLELIMANLIYTFLVLPSGITWMKN